MTVAELIEALKAMPQDMQVTLLEGGVGQGGSYTVIRGVRGVELTPKADIDTYMRDQTGASVVVVVPA